MSSYLKRGVAVTGYGFFLMDSGNRPAGKTSASPAVTISKDGSAFAAVAGSVTEIGSGFYKVNLTATETDARQLLIKASASGADDWRDKQLTDTILVSESLGEGLQISGVASGDTVWTVAEKERVLSRLQDIVQAVGESRTAVAEAMVESALREQGLRAAVAEVASAVRDAQTLLREARVSMRDGVERSRGAMLEESQRQWQMVEARLFRATQAVLAEASGSSERLAQMQRGIDEIVRLTVARLPSETLEQLHEAEMR
jgi:hypothetical protein